MRTKGEFDFIGDRECIPLVEFFNEIGLKTMWCCSGKRTLFKRKHGYNFYYIIFEDEVTDEKLNDVLNQFTYKTCFNGQPYIGPMSGWFCRRQWHNDTWRPLAYVAHSVKEANKDLKMLLKNKELNKQDV
jgi:hypothetical protein